MTMLERRTDLESLYRTMRRIRAADERIRTGLAAGDFGFSYWPVPGHEAISAGVAAALREGDQLIITYRGLANAVAAQVPLAEYFAELLGRSAGFSRGKAGPMGLSWPDSGLLISTGIVGAGAPIAVGAGWAQSLRGRHEATVVSFGDGATSIGSVHEAMNLAAVWDLPVVFLCENNQYGEHTPIAKYTRTEHFADRAAGYGMAGETIDGRNPTVVYDRVAAALELARSGGGPTFIEAETFRLEGHYFGDAMSAVDPVARGAAWLRDPIVLIEERIRDEDAELAACLAAIDAEIAEEVDAALASAMASPPPMVDDLTTDVAAGPVPFADATDPALDLLGEDAPTKRMGLAEAVNDALRIAMSQDETVILLGEDIADPPGGTFTATAGLSSEFGDQRVRATPISEVAIVGAATGAALLGYRPVAELMFMDFLGVCFDQIANHAAKIRYLTAGRTTAPLTIRTVVGTGNGPQHSQSWEALLTHIPGLKVVWPSNAYDAKGLLLESIFDPDPVVFIESMSLYFGGGRGAVPVQPYRVPLGQAATLRTGDDVTVVSYGPTVRTAAAVAEDLAADGISVEVIDLRTLVPLDIETVLSSVRRTGRLLVVHEAVEFGGFGAEVAATVSSRAHAALRAPVVRLGAAYSPVPHAAALAGHHPPTADDIAVAVRGIVA